MAKSDEIQVSSLLKLGENFILSKCMSYSGKGVTGSVAETINLVSVTDIILNNHIEGYNFAQK